MRIRNAAITLLALGITAILIAREWHRSEVQPEAPATVAPAAPVEAPGPSRAEASPPPPATPPKMSEPLAAPAEPAQQTEVAPRPHVSETQVDNPQGTTAAPGDPLSQPEDPSEQFMHSRRGDGQHSE